MCRGWACQASPRIHWTFRNVEKEPEQNNDTEEKEKTNEKEEEQVLTPSNTNASIDLVDITSPPTEKVLIKPQPKQQHSTGQSKEKEVRKATAKQNPPQSKKCSWDRQEAKHAENDLNFFGEMFEKSDSTLKNFNESFLSLYRIEMQHRYGIKPNDE